VQTINIVDVNGPTVSAPASVNLECGAASSVAALGDASVSDACFSGLTASHSGRSPVWYRMLTFLLRRCHCIFLLGSRTNQENLLLHRWMRSHWICSTDNHLR
jgi:hypothetical protein